jgi:hypothetical protein
MMQFPRILADCSLWLCPIVPLRIGVYVNTSHSSFDIQMFPSVYTCASHNISELPLQACITPVRINEDSN